MMNCYISLPEYFYIFKSHLAEKLAIKCMSMRVYYHSIPHPLQVRLLIQVIVNLAHRWL
jgi:hypothetical protein